MPTTLRNRGGVAPRPREFYLNAGREYIRRYGADALTAAAFNPAAAKRGGRPDLVDRYYAGREDGTAWPSLNAIKKSFDGFTKFREELGLPPNSTFPKGGRRPAGTAEPILEVRERRVIVPGEQTVWLTRQLHAAERRAARAEERLETEKSRVVEVPEDQTRLVSALRNRLADERSRRKDLKRELHNAVRREDRARMRAEIAAGGEDPATLREVDRLTDLLAEAEGRIRALEATPAGTKVVVQREIVHEAEPEIRTRTVTRTRKVTVPDEKSLRRAERAESRLADLREDLEGVRATRDDLADRLATIRREAVAEALTNQRVRSAEDRAAKLEKQLALQGELLVGQRRALSEEEIESLRRDGPAGEVLFARAVKKVSRAWNAGSRVDTRAALYESMSAAKNWMDRL